MQDGGGVQGERVAVCVWQRRPVTVPPRVGGSDDLQATVASGDSIDVVYDGGSGASVCIDGVQPES